MEQTQTQNKNIATCCGVQQSLALRMTCQICGELLTAPQQPAATAEAQSGGRMNWQPIETAPKDGTPVLLFVPSSEECVVAACFSNTWYSTYWQDEFLDDPSHWAHLPAAPYVPKTGTHVPEIETKDINGLNPDDQERAWQYASRVCAAFVGSQHGNARRLGPMSTCIRCAGPLYQHWLRQALVSLRTK